MTLAARCRDLADDDGDCQVSRLGRRLRWLSGVATWLTMTLVVRCRNLADDDGELSGVGIWPTMTESCQVSESGRQ